MLKVRALFELDSQNSGGTVFAAGENAIDFSNISAMTDLTVERLAETIIRGGWPSSIELPIEKSALVPQKVLDEIIESDVSRVDGVNRNPALVRSLIDSLARHVVSTAKITKIQQDMDNHASTLSRTSLDSYMETLQRIFVIEDLPAWNRYSAVPQWPIVEMMVYTSSQSAAYAHSAHSAGEQPDYITVSLWVSVLCCVS